MEKRELNSVWISQLNEWCQTRNVPFPTFDFITTVTHNRITHVCKGTLGNIVVFSSPHLNKRLAKNEAGYLLYQQCVMPSSSLHSQGHSQGQLTIRMASTNSASQLDELSRILGIGIKHHESNVICFGGIVEHGRSYEEACSRVLERVRIRIERK